MSSKHCISRASSRPASMSAAISAIGRGKWAPIASPPSSRQRRSQSAIRCVTGAPSGPSGAPPLPKGSIGTDAPTSPTWPSRFCRFSLPTQTACAPSGETRSAPRSEMLVWWSPHWVASRWTTFTSSARAWRSAVDGARKWTCVSPDTQRPPLGRTGSPSRTTTPERASSASRSRTTGATSGPATTSRTAPSAGMATSNVAGT